MESVAQADGTSQITISFQPGTSADLAQVEVQNRLSAARLPAVTPAKACGWTNRAATSCCS